MNRMPRMIGAVFRQPSMNLSVARLSTKAVDAALSSALVTEHTAEAKETIDSQFVSDFTRSSKWAIIDTPGLKHFNLKKTHGAEKITVTVSTEDLSSNYDEAEEEENDSQPPIPFTITIEKEGADQMLEIDASNDNDAIFIDYVKLLPVGGNAASNDKIYGGPEFNDLDTDLTETFNKFLEARGFDADLARFIPEYAQLKVNNYLYQEQKEYERWLLNVEQFISK